MPEGVPLYTDLTVKEFVTYMAELRKVDRKNKKEKVQEVLKETGLDTMQNKLIKNLSRGQKQRVSLAGTLVGNPKILILDEPTVGLDPKQITEIRSLIKNLGKNHTVILSSHILSEVSQICDKVIIINKGKLVATDTPENLERKVSNNNVLFVTVEDNENKLDSIKDNIEGVKSIKLIKTHQDNTKQYEITGEEDVNLNKIIFSEFAKEGITIFEMKKPEATLEDAFMKIIKEGGDK
jgi:ABC-2 type transport system ATP-binding protein